jgi:hypothetical protein
MGASPLLAEPEPPELELIAECCLMYAAQAVYLPNY